MQKRSAETTVTVPVPDHAELRIGSSFRSSGSLASPARCSSIGRRLAPEDSRRVLLDLAKELEEVASIFQSLV
jgi:hypothetical protein